MDQFVFAQSNGEMQHMSSEIERLRAQVDAVAQKAGAMAANLNGFRQDFKVVANQVQATIGGSSTGTDRRLVDQITAAQRQVDQAAASLLEAMVAAQQYGRSL
jgi:hypothetical protein